MTTLSYSRSLMCISFLVLACALQAQFKSPRFSYLTASQGLSQNSVNDIYQDQWGYLWFATQDGLNRYDGYEFKVYKPETENEWGISDNFVTKIIPADSGNLWILCRYGLNYFERKSDRFYKFYIGSLNELSQPKDVTVWNGQTLAVVGYETFVVPENFDQPKTLLQETFDIGLDSTLFILGVDDRLLVECRGKVVVYDGNKILQTFTTQARPSSNQHLKRFGDEVLFGVGSVGFRYNVSSSTFDTLCYGYHLEEIQDVLPKPDGSVWVAHIQGISVFRNKTEIGYIQHQSDVEGALSYPLVHSMFKDSQGTVWIGTANGGLNYVTTMAEKFRHISIEDGLSDKQVWCVFPEDAEHIWVGTELGLNYIEHGVVSAKYPKLRDQFKSSRITAFHRDRNNRIWIGTSRQGLYFTDDPNATATQVDLAAANVYQQSVSCFLERDDGIWVGTLGYMHHLSFRGEIIKSFNDVDAEGHFRLGYILSLLSDDERIYVGAANGLHVVNPEGEIVEQYVYLPNGDKRHPNFQFITSIAKHADKIWMSTFGGGLNAFDPASKSFEYFETNAGLSNLVLAGMEIIDDEIWVAHNLGISSFSLSNYRFKNFGIRDGLPFPEFSLGAGASADKRFMFGGTGGLIVLKPEDFNSSDYDARPFINEYSINYGKTSSPLARIPETIDQITVLPDHNVISLKFLVPDYLQAHRLRYSYVLDGFDADWVDAPINERRATYSNLPAGDYTFRVRVFNQDGIRSPNELEILVTVIPPIWKRTWFLVLAGLSVLLIVVVSVRYLSRMRIKRQLRELELQERIHKERARISMDLHDHVGAHITYLISNLDRLSIRDPSEEHNYSGLGSYAREAMRELRDTVWAIRNDAMELKELLQRISQFGYGLFEDSKVQFKMDTQVAPGIKLDPAPSLHLMRIMQECIHNVKRHANATEVVVTTKLDNRELIVEVADNGSGFSNENIDESEHNGLRNMKDRASEIGALLTIKSIADQGTSIVIRLPLRNKANALFRDRAKSTSLVP